MCAFEVMGDGGCVCMSRGNICIVFVDMYFRDVRAGGANVFFIGVCSVQLMHV